MINFISKGFFVKKISPRFGEKCCKYGQNGISLSIEQVDLMSLNLKKFINGWNFNKERTIMYKYLYLENYYYSSKIIGEIIKLDMLTTKNKPNFELKNTDLLKINLSSLSLKGLSQVDFELAMKINQLQFEDYNVIEIDNENNYRAKIRMLKNDKENNKIQDILKNTNIKN